MKENIRRFMAEGLDYGGQQSKRYDTEPQNGHNGYMGWDCHHRDSVKEKGIDRNKKNCSGQTYCDKPNGINIEALKGGDSSLFCFIGTRNSF